MDVQKYQRSSSMSSKRTRGKEKRGKSSEKFDWVRTVERKERKKDEEEEEEEEGDDELVDEVEDDDGEVYHGQYHSILAIFCDPGFYLAQHSQQCHPNTLEYSRSY
ncbi:hypothetical protein M0804_000892 [Polistes exclamans]|nr:hypothetical protein M0804_000892 [Polistes exclamans]